MLSNSAYIFTSVILTTERIRAFLVIMNFFQTLTSLIPLLIAHLLLIGLVFHELNTSLLWLAYCFLYSLFIFLSLLPIQSRCLVVFTWEQVCYSHYWKSCWCFPWFSLDFSRLLWWMKKWQTIFLQNEVEFFLIW